MTAYAPVIKSLLETDLYKFTMWQAMLHNMPANQAEYRFVCRNKPQYPLAQLADQVNRELDSLCTLRFTEAELSYLGSLRYLKSDFIDFLRIFQLQRRYLTVSTRGEELVIVAKGPQIHVMAFEIYVLAIVNELYFRHFDQEAALAEATRRLDSKITLLREFFGNPTARLVEAGTLRVHASAPSAPSGYSIVDNSWNIAARKVHEEARAVNGVRVDSRPLSDGRILELWDKHGHGLRFARALEAEYGIGVPASPGEQPAERRHPFEFFDFGVRRRFSGAWHEAVVGKLAKEVPEFFRGTSNVYLAHKLGLVPIGTMAHEYLQSFQAMGVQLKNFQKAALETWVQEYRGDLGIALTDTVGMDAFLADFDLYFAKLFDGLRHDSGDPVAWGEKALAHYAKLRVDPHTKRLVFSDGLDLPSALALYAHFADRVPTGFGIGTNLTNDAGLTPLNIVMKLVRVNGQPTAKLSDSPGKTLCEDETFLAYLRQVFKTTP